MRGDSSRRFYDEKSSHVCSARARNVISTLKIRYMWSRNWATIKIKRVSLFLQDSDQERGVWEIMKFLFAPSPRARSRSQRINVRAPRRALPKKNFNLDYYTLKGRLKVVFLHSFSHSRTRAQFHFSGILTTQFQWAIDFVRDSRWNRCWSRRQIGRSTEILPPNSAQNNRQYWWWFGEKTKIPKNSPLEWQKTWMPRKVSNLIYIEHERKSYWYIPWKSIIINPRKQWNKSGFLVSNTSKLRTLSDYPSARLQRQFFLILTSCNFCLCFSLEFFSPLIQLLFLYLLTSLPRFYALASFFSLFLGYYNFFPRDHLFLITK